jgi:hypothetical protein
VYIGKLNWLSSESILSLQWAQFDRTLTKHGQSSNLSWRRQEYKPCHTDSKLVTLFKFCNCTSCYYKNGHVNDSYPYPSLSALNFSRNQALIYLEAPTESTPSQSWLFKVLYSTTHCRPDTVILQTRSWRWPERNILLVSPKLKVLPCYLRIVSALVSCDSI